MTEREKIMLETLDRCAADLGEISHHIADLVNAPLCIAPKKAQNLRDYTYDLFQRTMDIVHYYRKAAEDEKLN